jgi:dihydrofolate reductase
MVNLIVAVDKNMGIGYNGKLPWPKNNADMRLFRRLTTGGVVVMGRKTYESVGVLRGRTNVVISNRITSEVVEKPVIWAGGKLAGVVAQLGRFARPIWLIGGAEVYRQALEDSIVNHLHISYMKEAYEVDTYFPILAVSGTFELQAEEQFDGFIYARYKKRWNCF